MTRKSLNDRGDALDRARKVVEEHDVGVDEAPQRPSGDPRRAFECAIEAGRAAIVSRKPADVFDTGSSSRLSTPSSSPTSTTWTSCRSASQLSIAFRWMSPMWLRNGLGTVRIVSTRARVQSTGLPDVGGVSHTMVRWPTRRSR